MSDDYTHEVFRSRAVAEHVAAERGYRRYAAGQRDTVLEVDSRLAENPAWLRGALEAPGWVLPKFAVMPDHPDFGSRPYAQLRPDWPVMARWYGHSHGPKGFTHRHKDDERLAGRGGQCRCGLIHTSPPVKTSPDWDVKLGPGPSFAEAYAERKAKRSRVEWVWYQPPLKNRAAHENSVCDAADVPPELEARLGIRRGGELLRDRKGRIIVPTGHLHPETGETIVATDRPHKHLDWAKYLYVKGRGRAQRLGTHPRMLQENFAAPNGLLFWAIEGTLKLDAIVSAGWPGIETGSVTLWDAEIWDEMSPPPPGVPDNGSWVYRVHELKDFAARHLDGVRVAVCCDSDWDENSRVIDQVTAAVALLRGVGVEAVGCAPPPGRELGWLDRRTGHPKRAKQGIDDYLAAERDAGRDTHEAMLRLHVRDEVSGAPGDADAVRAVVAHADAAPTATRVLHNAQRRSTAAGTFAYREKQIAASTELGTSTVQEYRNSFEDTGAWVKLSDVEYRVTENGVVKAIAPVFQLREDLRPRATPRTLRDWLAS